MKAIVLAAGKGKRLLSEQFNMPKVLRQACGKSLIEHVLNNISFIPKEDTCIVVGYKKEMVCEAVGNEYNYAVQEEQLGTGHAVMMAEPLLREYDGEVLILYGDMPLFKEETYSSILEKHRESGAGCTILTAVIENPPDYGRIIRDDKGSVIDIVEKKDCTPEQIKINELNVGIYVFNSKLLFEALKGLNNNNSQKEYYLTDVPKIMLQKGIKVESHTIKDSDEIYGVNTLEELELCEKIMRERAQS